MRLCQFQPGGDLITTIKPERVFFNLITVITEIQQVADSAEDEESLQHS